MADPAIDPALLEAAMEEARRAAAEWTERRIKKMQRQLNNKADEIRRLRQRIAELEAPTND